MTGTSVKEDEQKVLGWQVLNELKWYGDRVSCFVEGASVYDTIKYGSPSLCFTNIFDAFLNLDTNTEE